MKWQWRIAAAALVLVGCERKAPGPAECQRVATVMLRISDERLLADPRVKTAYDRVVVECLTTPYDRAFVACVERGGETRVCALEMQQRRLANRAPRAP